MARVASGGLDRRLMIQVVNEQKDSAGDVTGSTWDDAFKLWAKRTPKGSGVEVTVAPGVLRQFDILWEVRDGPKARSIGPETHRILYKGRIYEIVGIVPGLVRADLVSILTAARPDQRGSRGTDGASGEP